MEEDKNARSFKTGENQERQSLGSFVWDLVKIFVLALVIIIPLRMFVAEPYIVSGSSMVPNFHNKEYLVIDKLTYRFYEPQRGQVIVLKFPNDTAQFFIKRIIGLPGETMELADGRVKVINSRHPQGEVLNEAYLPSQAVTFGGSKPVTLGQDEYFVLGDNRLASSDSRVWGILPKRDIVGKVWLRAFPLNRLGLISAAAY